MRQFNEKTMKEVKATVGLYTQECQDTDIHRFISWYETKLELQEHQKKQRDEFRRMHD